MKKMKNLFLFTFILLLTHAGIAQDKKDLKLKDLFQSRKFSQAMVYGLTSMDDGIHYTTIERGQNNQSIVKYSYKTGKMVDTIFSLKDFKDSGIKQFQQYSFSPDESKILLVTNYSPIYRHSFTADFYIYNREKNVLKPVSENGAQRLATFSPDGSKIAFVRDNNLFIKDLQSGVEKQITNDGKYNHIINGTTDWVYEEEFAFTQGFKWSPEGDKIAFYKFDESRVKVFHMTMYNRELYPEDYSFKYPKAGEKNSIVKIFVYDLNNESIKEMDTGEETDQYIPRMKWTKDNNKLCIVRMNRLQNEVEILTANPQTGESETIYNETNKYYITEIDDDYPTFLEDGKHFLIKSEKDGNNHFYLYDMKGNLVNQVTEGKWDVSSFYGYNPESERIFYSSTEESPLERYIYSIKTDGSKKRKIIDKKGWNRAAFSSTFDYFINYHSTANTPYEISVHNHKGKLIRVLESNQKLKEKLNEYNFAKKEFISINTPSSKWDLNGYMIKPNNFDPDKEYPVFMHLYGGPGSQSVRDAYDGRYLGWFSYLAQKGYIVVVVDNRGTGGRGEEFKKMTYGELGKYETIDQIEVAEYLGNKPFIDKDRIGIFGWSYGGFMAANCLFQGNHIFSMAISVAPVTNWRYYDTIYTERYMGLPQDNPDGYDDNSPINHVDGLKGDFLLIHGTGDDNVHFQNSIELTEKLVQANKQFEQQFYPDKNHGIYGGNTTFHLYTKMTNFILNNL
jgi:dipeptidyl-peptidase-4